nr:MAG TPA: hypothetical protein [Caudoviricetes sp.]
MRRFQFSSLFGLPSESFAFFNKGTVAITSNTLFPVPPSSALSDSRHFNCEPPAVIGVWLSKLEHDEYATPTRLSSFPINKLVYP